MGHVIISYIDACVLFSARHTSCVHLCRLDTGTLLAVFVEIGIYFFLAERVKKVFTSGHKKSKKKKRAREKKNTI